jgi:hypothetical protein
VPNLTIGAPVVQSLRKHSDAFFDCHLMVTHPEQWVDVSLCVCVCVVWGSRGRGLKRPHSAGPAGGRPHIASQCLMLSVLCYACAVCVCVLCRTLPRLVLVVVA